MSLFIPHFLLAIPADAMKSQTMILNHELIARFDILFDIGQRHGHVDTALEGAHHGFLVAHENFLIGFDKNDTQFWQGLRRKKRALRRPCRLWTSEKPLV